MDASLNSGDTAHVLDYVWGAVGFRSGPRRMRRTFGSLISERGEAAIKIQPRNFLPLISRMETN
jgi:hypothetical protein